MYKLSPGFQLWKILVDGIKKGTNYLQASNYGRYCSQFGVFLYPNPPKKGYIDVGVDNKTFNMHILITKDLLPDDNLRENQVDRKDLNHSDNKLYNLEWVQVTASENIRISFVNNINCKSCLKNLLKLILGRVSIGDVKWTKYLSALEVDKSLDVSINNVSQVC